jgi:hypothetical protein
MIKPCKIHLPRTQEDLDEIRKLDEAGKLGHGDSPGPTLEQIAAYEARKGKPKKKLLPVCCNKRH